MKKYILVLSTLGILILGVWVAIRKPVVAHTPYNDNADAKLEIKQALARAASTQTPVVVVFGANWCPDCLELDHAMKSGDCASFMARHYQIVKVSVGRLDKNIDIAASYGVSPSNGVPDVVILSPQNKVLYVTREGELVKARDMGDAAIYDFFKRVTAAAKP